VRGKDKERRGEGAWGGGCVAQDFLEGIVFRSSSGGEPFGGLTDKLVSSPQHTKREREKKAGRGGREKLIYRVN
jgi:hypothetical protein